MLVIKLRYVDNKIESLPNTNTVATINIGGGVLNREYIFTCNIVDSTGSQAERTVKMRIREN